MIKCGEIIALNNKIRTACTLQAVNEKSRSLPKIKEFKDTIRQVCTSDDVPMERVITPEANEHEFQMRI